MFNADVSRPASHRPPRWNRNCHIRAPRGYSQRLMTLKTPVPAGHSKLGGNHSHQSKPSNGSSSHRLPSAM